MSLIFSGNFDLIEFECVLNLTTSSNFYCTVGESSTASEPFYFINHDIFLMEDTCLRPQSKNFYFFDNYNLICTYNFYFLCLMEDFFICVNL